MRKTLYAARRAEVPGIAYLFFKFFAVFSIVPELQVAYIAAG